MWEYNSAIAELEEIWRPKWHISLYYKIRHFLLHGQWPLRIWRCKDMLGPVDGDLYKRKYQQVLKDMQRPL